VHLEKYIIEYSEDFLLFSFYSIGPNGIIKKMVEFDLISSLTFDLYNLGLGDANESGDAIDDTVISNNHDTEKVLATVAYIALEFNKHFPHAFISIEANTDSKMRLYQMKINKYWKEIKDNFDVFGYLDDGTFSPYKPGIKCLSVVGRKKLK
jgi:hypothetical protein